MLFFSNKLKISLLLITTFLLMFVAIFQKADSEEGWQCQELPIGQISERLLVIQDELIIKSFFIKKEYEKMFSPARKAAELSYHCLEEAETYCPTYPSCCSAGGNPCQNLAQIDEKLAEVEQINQIIRQKIPEFESLISEIEDLKIQLKEATTALAQWNPEEEGLMDCPAARSFGYIDIDNCSAVNNYYICKWQK